LGMVKETMTVLKSLMCYSKFSNGKDGQPLCIFKDNCVHQNFRLLVDERSKLKGINIDFEFWKKN